MYLQLQHVPAKFLMTSFRIDNSALEDGEVAHVAEKLRAMHASDFRPIGN